MKTFRSLAVLAVVGAVTASPLAAHAAPHHHLTTKHHGAHHHADAVKHGPHRHADAVKHGPHRHADAVKHGPHRHVAAGSTVATSGTTEAKVALAASSPASEVSTPDSGLVPVQVPRSIDATGTQDVTSALNAFFAQLPDHSIVEFPVNGRFRIEDVVTLASKQNVTLEGNGSTLFATTTGYRERNLLTVAGGADIVIRDFHLVGVHPDPGADGTYVAALEGQHGIRLLGPQRVLIENNTIKDVYGDFVYISYDLRKKLPTWHQPARDVTIRNNQFSSNGRQGVSFVNAQRVLVQDNTIGDIKRTVFDFEPNTSGELVDGVTIDHNAIGVHHLNFVSGGGDGSVNNVMISNNTLHGSAMNSVIKNQLGETRLNWSFIGNTSDRGFGSTLGAVVYARGATGVEFSRNVQPMNKRPASQGPMAGLRIDNGCSGVATGNNLGQYGGAQVIGTFAPCAEPITLGQVATAAAVGSGS